MMHLLLSVLVALVAISIIPTVFSESLREEFTIPDWVKNTAGWWADGQIPDSAFLQGIQFLIKEEIITVQIPTVDSEAVEEVPGWVKNTVAWWAEGKIHDITFAGAIKYLLSQGIITVEQEQVEELVEETVEINDFYMEVNGDNCCQNWAYVGKDYLFQIETLDKHRGSPIDGVAITAKIISKDGELRYDFGQVATENGIYKNNITIPSMDWYAGNILSVTGEYYGVEKTIEKEFEVFISGDRSAGGAIGDSPAGDCALVSPVSVEGQDTLPTGIAFSNNGEKMFIAGAAGDDINEYELSGAYCIGTATFVDAFSIASQEGAPKGIAFSNDGKKMFIVGNDGNDVNEYALDTSFDVSTSAFVDAFSVASQDEDPTDIVFNNDGTKMFITGKDGKDVNEYILEAFDVSSATFVDSFSVSTQLDVPQAMAFNNDGTKMFVVGSDDDDVEEYILTSPFDVSTAVFVVAFNVRSQEQVPMGMWFDPSGTKMFILGSDGDDVNIYKLETAFDVSTAGFQP